MGPYIGRPRCLLAVALVVSLFLIDIPARAEVSEVTGRYRADYQEIETSLLASSRLQQQFDVGVEDRLFGASTLRFNFTSQRYTDVDRGLSVSSHRLRFHLTGNTYNLIGLYSPRSGSTYGVEDQGDESEDVQLTWMYTAPRMPTVRATYRRNKHFEASGAVGSKSRERSLELAHRIGFVEMTGLWRRIDHDLGTATSGRGQEHFIGRVTARRDLAPGVTADMALDLQDADNRTEGVTTSETQTRNFRAGVAWIARRNLKAHLNVLDRKTNSASSGDDNDGLNREISARMTWLPITSVKMDLRRDIRDVELGSADTHSDILRYQGSWNGRVRSRVRGRFNVILNHAISTRNISAPADNADLTFDSGLFPRTTLRTTLLVSRRHGDTTSLIGRYGIQRYVDLRMKLTRRLESNFTWRAILNTERFRLNESTNKGVTAGLIFTGSRGLTASAAYRRSVDTTQGGRVGNSLTGNVHLTVSKDWSWSASWTLTDSKVADEETIEGDTKFIRTNYNIGPRTSFHVSWSESTPVGGDESTGFSASFTTAF